MSLRSTGRLVVADHGNNAVVRIDFVPIQPPESQARVSVDLGLASPGH